VNGPSGPSGRTVLLTGATGFVGRYVYEPLVEAGWTVRCATRNVAAAQERWPDREWVRLDLADADSVEQALEGCDAALYLIHGMASHAEDFRQAEVHQAEKFSAMAAQAGLKRIVYLGGVAADADPSEHLRSREEVGEALRAGDVPTIELRASMIVGEGSLSWLIVRDLTARLPVMILPSWLRSRTEPVSIHDITIALVRSLDLEMSGSDWFDVPGPEVLSGREILERTAMALGVAKPLMIQVPFLSPKLSSHWVRFVTRAEWSVAREIVVGLKTDLIARDDRFWSLIEHAERQSFDHAAGRALEDERARPPLRGVWAWIERALVQIAEPTRERESAAGSRERGFALADWRAVAYGLVWLVGAWASGYFGIWPAVGTTAVLLGVAVIGFEGLGILVRGLHIPRLILGMVVGLAMAAGTILLFEPVAAAFPALRTDVARLYSAFQSPGALATILMFPLVVASEEIVWRGAVHNALARRVSLPLAVVAGAALYTLAHVPIGSPALLLAALGAGLCWSTLRAYTDSLPAVIAAHLVWDLLVLVFYQLTP
jgi:uncharacterized protein YbjT (DUF2867 family)/membrane protease YdiL (CAAX protease family)